jgi:predicted hydrocarbon binding protein
MDDKADKKQIDGQVVAAPKWTNPYIGICAMISATVNAYGLGALDVLRKAFIELGKKTGEYMIGQGLVKKGASIHEWGKMTIDLLDLTGIYSHDVIQDDADNFVIKVEDCGYQEPFRYINAPADVCQVPIQWDNGCLQTINPELHTEIVQCAYKGDGHCIYHIKRRKVE